MPIASMKERPVTVLSPAILIVSPGFVIPNIEFLKVGKLFRMSISFPSFLPFEVHEIVGFIISNNS